MGMPTSRKQDPNNPYDSTGFVGGSVPGTTFNVNQPLNQLSTPGQFTGQSGIQGLTVGSTPTTQFFGPSPTQSLTTTNTPQTTDVQFQAGAMGPGAPIPPGTVNQSAGQSAGSDAQLSQTGPAGSTATNTFNAAGSQGPGYYDNMGNFAGIDQAQPATGIMALAPH